MTDTASSNDRAIETAQRLMAMRRAKAVDRTEIPLDRLLARHDKAALGVRLEWERMGERPVSDALEQRAAELGVEFEHLGLTLGSILHGVDLREPTPELFAFVRAALLERKVVFFRDQHLDEAQQVAFGSGFGELDAFPFGRPGSDPYILQIVHGPGSPGFENGWHTDVTWMEEPSLGSIAQLVE
ncbi:MAG: TauD/TfdA family dioxygenase, partial [Actinomycetota bacterium]